MTAPTPDTQPTFSHAGLRGSAPKHDQDACAELELGNIILTHNLDQAGPRSGPEAKATDGHSPALARLHNAERRAERLQERADALRGKRRYHAMLDRLNTAREACLIAHSELRAVTHD